MVSGEKGESKKDECVRRSSLRVHQHVRQVRIRTKWHWSEFAHSEILLPLAVGLAFALLHTFGDVVRFRLTAWFVQCCCECLGAWCKKANEWLVQEIYEGHRLWFWLRARSCYCSLKWAKRRITFMCGSATASLYLLMRHYHVNDSCVYRSWKLGRMRAKGW